MARCPGWRAVTCALVALLLAFALPACSDGAATQQGEPAAPVQGPAIPQAEDADEQPTWGHASFAGGDGYSVISSPLELSRSFDIELEGKDLRLAVVHDGEKDGSAGDGDDFLFVFRQDEPGAGRDQAIACIQDLTGTRVHGEVTLDNGVTFYYAYLAGEGDDKGIEAYLVEADDDGVWVAIASSLPDDGGGILSLVNVGRKRTLADLVLRGAADGEETMRVGGPDVGYIDVPVTWEESGEADLPGVLVWCDPTGATSVSIESVTFEEVAWEEVAERGGYEVTADDLAMALAYNAMVEFDELEGAEVTSACQLTVGGAVAFCVDAQLGNGVAATTLLVAGDRRVYVVEVEGDPVLVDQLVWRATQGFSAQG